MRRPIILLHSGLHEHLDDAVAAGRRVEGWFRARKVAYMAGEFEALQAFAVRRGKKRGGGVSFDTGPSDPAQDEGGGVA